jgi:hypothetical protein
MRLMKLSIAFAERNPVTGQKVAIRRDCLNKTDQLEAYTHPPSLSDQLALTSIHRSV